MKHSFIVLALLGITAFTTVKAQTIEPTVINSSGGTKFINGIRHDYSFGETGPISTVEIANTAILTQGFLQPVQPMSCSALIPGTITTDFSLCANQPFSLSIQNSSAGDFYQNGQWQYLSQGATNWMNIPGANDTVYTSTGLNVTTQFRYFLYCLSDSNTIQQTQTTTITILPTPQVNLGNDQTVCEGTTIVLDAGAGNNYDYQWSNGSTNQQITVSSGQQYSVVVDNGTCTATDTIFLNYIQAPSATTINATNTGSSSFNFSPANTGANQTYTWDFGDGNTASGANANHNYTQTGTYTVTLTITNSCGTYVATTTVVVQGTGIVQTKVDDKINLYPNPASDLLTIQSEENAIVNYTIYNSLGQLIQQKIVNKEQFQINISHLSSGMYTIQLNTRTNKLIKKFQVK